MYELEQMGLRNSVCNRCSHLRGLFLMYIKREQMSFLNVVGTNVTQK